MKRGYCVVQKWVSTPGKKRIRRGNDSLKLALIRCWGSDDYAVRGRKAAGRPSKASLLSCSSSSSIPSRPSTTVTPRAPSPLSWEWCQRHRQPLQVSERTWWFVLKEKHWQQRTLVPKKVLFPIVLEWWFHSAPLLSLWVSFLNYFRFCGAEWSFDVKKL